MKDMHPNKTKILDALRAIKTRTGQEKVGPKQIAQEAGISAALVSAHIKGLIESELIERCPQGTRRALYRLPEVV